MTDVEKLIGKSKLRKECKEFLIGRVFSVEELHAYLTVYPIGDAHGTKLADNALAASDDTYRNYVQVPSKDRLLRAPLGAMLPLQRSDRNVSWTTKASKLEDIGHPTPQAKDQGNRATCVAFALTAMIETPGENHSEQFLHWATKALYDPVHEREETALSLARAALAIDGICDEKLMGYDPNNATLPDDGTVEQAVLRRRTVRIRRKVSAEAVHEALLAGPVALTLKVFPGVGGADNWWSPIGAVRGKVLDPPDSNGAAEIGHCVCLVGYMSDPRAPGGGWFLVRNSWLGWGVHATPNRGYGRVSASHVTHHGVEFCYLQNRSTNDGESGAGNERSIEKEIGSAGQYQPTGNGMLQEVDWLETDPRENINLKYGGYSISGGGEGGVLTVASNYASGPMARRKGHYGWRWKGVHWPDQFVQAKVGVDGFTSGVTWNWEEWFKDSTLSVVEADDVWPSETRTKVWQMSQRDAVAAPQDLGFLIRYDDASLGFLGRTGLLTPDGRYRTGDITYRAMAPGAFVYPTNIAGWSFTRDLRVEVNTKLERRPSES